MTGPEHIADKARRNTDHPLPNHRAENAGDWDIADGAGGYTLTPQPNNQPVWIFTRETARQIDRAAHEEFGIPTLVLMENAALSLAAHALGMCEDPEGVVLIFAGKGNNAGDGFALARHLSNAGQPVCVILAAEKSDYSGDSAINLRICEKMKLPLISVCERAGAGPLGSAGALERALDLFGDPVLVVDALLGTGLSGAVRGVIGEIIAQINALADAGSPVLAVDIPSGLDADTGEPVSPGGPVVRADLTVSLVGLKQGFLPLAAQEYLGDVVIGDIGCPRELVRRLGTIAGESHWPGESEGKDGERTAGGPDPYRPGEERASDAFSR